MKHEYRNLPESFKLGANRSIYSVLSSISYLAFSFFLILRNPGMIRAQITNPATGNLGDDFAAASDGSLFAILFVYFWNVAISIGGLIVLVFFIQATIEWITAGGDSGKIQKARDRMLQSFIGLAILVFSFVIINFIGAMIFGDNFQILNITLPSADQLDTLAPAAQN